MPSATYGVTFSAAGLNFSKTITRTGSGSAGVEESLPVAEAGTLTTRTDDDTGTITMTSGGHTITTGAVIDIHWSGGVQYGVTVGTVSGTAVPFDAGAGDVLPADETAVTVVVQTSIGLALDGDNAKIVGILVAGSTDTDATAVHLTFKDSAGDTIAEMDLVPNAPRVIDITGGDTNIFTGDPITTVKASQAGTDVARTLTIAVVQDATP